MVSPRYLRAATLLQNCEDIEEAGIIAMARVKEDLVVGSFVSFAVVFRFVFRDH